MHNTRFLASALPLVMIAALAGCPKDKPVAKADTAIPLDTTPKDLSQITPDIPPPAPDTFKRVPLPTPQRVRTVSYPDAPPALQDAVQREQAVSRFCFQEVGLKSDPSLNGGVAMLVTVGGSGIDDARVADASWSARKAGSQVNECLNRRLKTAWKLEPGAVKPGKYVVQLSFRGS